MASLTSIDSDIPHDLKCGICLDIAIDPVVPSTKDKTEAICKHFLCKACEFTNRAFILETSGEINCPQCRKKYQEVMPEGETAVKIKDFVKNNPHIFNDKSYEELVKDRKPLIPVVKQLQNALQEERFDEIEEIANQIKDEGKKSQVLFYMLVMQIKKGNVDVAKTLVKLIPQTLWQKVGSRMIIDFYFNSKKEQKAEEYVMSLPNNQLKKAFLESLISKIQEKLSQSDLTEDHKTILFTKALTFIDIASEISLEASKFIDTLNTLFTKADLYIIYGQPDKAGFFLQEAEKQSELIPNGAYRCSILIKIAAQFLHCENRDSALTLLKKVGDHINELGITSTTQNLLYLGLFYSFYLCNDPKEMEHYARKLPEDLLSMSDTDIPNELKKDLTPIYPDSEDKFTEISDKQISDFLIIMNIDDMTICTTKLQALLGVANKYLENNEIKEGLRLLNELKSIPGDAPLPSIFEEGLDLKKEITDLIKSTYENMLQAKNISACEQIETSNLISTEEVQEIKQKLKKEELEKALRTLKKEELEKARLRTLKKLRCMMIPFAGLVLSYGAYAVLNLNKQN